MGAEAGAERAGGIVGEYTVEPSLCRWTGASGNKTGSENHFFRRWSRTAAPCSREADNVSSSLHPSPGGRHAPYLAPFLGIGTVVRRLFGLRLRKHVVVDGRLERLVDRRRISRGRIRRRN